MKATLPFLLALTVSALSSIAAAADAPVEKVTVRATAHFGFNQTAIAPADQTRILADVAKLTDVTWKTVTATGHTDSVGPSSYNTRLSARRARRAFRSAPPAPRRRRTKRPPGAR